MVQNHSYYKRLVLGFINNSISADQVKELHAFIQSEPESYAQLMDEPEVLFLVKQQMERNAPEISSELDQRFGERIREAVEQVKSTHKKPLLVRMSTAWRWAAAAVLIIAIGTIAIVLSRNENGKTEIVTTNNNTNTIQTDAPPGKNGAILTLADGTRVLLDSLGNGVVTTQGKTKVLIKNNQLVYEASVKQQEVLYNTMTTPKGRQYQVVLPDGSRVWLNAASTITYPTVFSGKERSVTLTGEAYFEVASLPLTASGGGGKKMPFKVIIPPQPGGTGGAEVEVLGTHFNINAYNDEGAIKTTLLEGKVKVVNRQSVPQSGSNRQSAVLQPGEQAVLTNYSKLTIDDHADVETVMAWKNGRFQFNRTPLPEVMRQLSRWYDIEVQYIKDTPDVVFAGKIGRDLNLSQVLNVLSKMEVNFKVEGKKLTVMP